MMEFEWKALRAGHHVSVHEADMSLVPGTVTSVEARPGSFDIAIRVVRDGRPVVIRPRRLAVHLDDGSAFEPCWRCDLDRARTD